MRRALLLLLGLLAPTPALRAQVIYGALMESGSQAPLPGGVMTLLDRDSMVVTQLQTDSVGGFSFTLPRHGTYRLRAEQAGYRAATSPALVMGGLDTLQVEFSLAQDVVVLKPLVIKARSRRLTAAARRFYERAGSGIFGTFITREQIERVHPLRTTELFHRVPGMHTTPMMGGNNVTVRGTCRPTVHVDGVRVNGYRSIDDLVQPQDLEGVEVYRSAYQAPPEFTGLLAGCAVILIWTRLE